MSSNAKGESPFLQPEAEDALTAAKSMADKALDDQIDSVCADLEHAEAAQWKLTGSLEAACIDAEQVEQKALRYLKEFGG